MPVSASEVEKLEASKKAAVRRRHTEGFRVEAVQYHLRAREIDPRKTIRDCAREPGLNDKTLDDRVLEFGDQGKVTRGRTDDQRALDEANRCIRDLVRRDFTSPVPTYKLVGGITYLRTTTGFTCLATATGLRARTRP